MINLVVMYCSFAQLIFTCHEKKFVFCNCFHQKLYGIITFSQNKQHICHSFKWIVRVEEKELNTYILFC